MSQGPLAVRRVTSYAALIAAAAACTGKTDTPAAATSATDARATAVGTTDASAPDARAAGASSTPGDSASGTVVTHSVPPTAQDRRVAVPDSGQTADTNHSGMAVKNSGASKRAP